MENECCEDLETIRAIGYAGNHWKRLTQHCMTVAVGVAVAVAEAVAVAVVVAVVAAVAVTVTVAVAETVVAET